MPAARKNNRLAELIDKNNARRKSGDLLDKRAVEVKSIDKENHRIDAIVSTASQDRDGDIILPSAFKKSLAGYLKNPVILSCHQHKLDDGRSPVVGTCVDARIDKNALHVTIEFETETDLGREYWTLYANKRMRAFSVGFVPVKWKDEGRSRIYTEVELLEISCVPVPSNRDALSKSAKKKNWLKAKKNERTKRKDEKILNEILSEPDDNKTAEFAEMLLCDDQSFEKAVGYEKTRSPQISADNNQTIKSELRQKFASERDAFGDKKLYERYLKFKEYRFNGYSVKGCFSALEIKLFDNIMENGIDAGLKQLAPDQSNPLLEIVARG